MKRLSISLLIFLLIMSMTISVQAVSSVPEYVIKATESTVRVLAEYTDSYSTGSGFVIKSDKEETLVATNYHVVEGKPYSISVWLSEDETVSATILAFTSQKDMCILKLAYPISMRTIIFAEDGAKQGEAVFAVGFPGAADYLSDNEAHISADATITDGIVSAVREATVSGYGTPTKILQINAAINSGNSGGPLFNAKGEVVGINTYGLNDSQGIFGAIDASELKAFMADHSIPVQNNESGFSWVALVFACSIAVGIIVVLILVMRKRRVKAQVKGEVKNSSLHKYMEAHPEGIGTNDAVAMLLPVALHLRDLHDNRSPHLQVSPNTITVGPNGAILANATAAESDRYASGYAAPEIYRGSSDGALSDIYSFCAVLSYVASGKQPVNSIVRTDAEVDDVSEQFDGTFAEVIRKGMALESAKRFASMRDVIIELSAYNVQPFVNTKAAVESSASEAAPAKKTKALTKAIVFVAVLVLALLGTYYGCYIGAKTNAQNGDFSTADNLLFASQITKRHDVELVAYIDAGLLMADRKYGEASLAFKKLSGYLNADEMVKAADYCHAIQYADANDFDNAVIIMTELSKAGYKDAENKIHEIQYRKGVYLLLEESNYYEADKIFTQLAINDFDGADEMQKETQYLWACALIEDGDYVDAYEKMDSIRDYSDVNDVMDALEEVIYAEGQSLYYDACYYRAKTCFSCIPSYADSKKYIILINARGFGALMNVEGTVEKLKGIFYFEDAAELLLSDGDIAAVFLQGTWKGDDYYFTMDEKGGISYNLPWIDYGDYYRISDGNVLLFPKDDRNDTKKLFYIEAITPDSIEVFCYKDNRCYTLFRQ